MKKFIVSLLILFLTAHGCLADTVFFNVKTHKYHKQTCRYATKCTTNCIKIEKQQAKNKGGIPCKVCGG